MGLVLEYDAKNNVLRGALDGQVTDEILRDAYATMARYTAIHGPCRGLSDFSGVTKFDVSGNTIRELTRCSPIVPTGYVRVVVAPEGFLYGMMRMFQILSEETRPELWVVQTMEEAYRLLGVESPEFVPINLDKTG